MREVRRTVVEALVIATISVMLGFGANAVNQDGVQLTRNNFPKMTVTHTGPATTPASQASRPAGTSLSDPASAAENATMARLASAGISVARYEDVKSLLADPLYGTTKFLIDARDDDHFTAGHISGSYQLDHYHLDRYMPALLPLLLPSQQVIVYCNGGDCEDSELTAIELVQNGVSRSALSVYVGGYKDWIGRHESLEKGERGSGQIIPAPAP